MYKSLYKNNKPFKRYYNVLKNKMFLLKRIVHLMSMEEYCNVSMIKWIEVKGMCYGVVKGNSPSMIIRIVKSVVVVVVLTQNTVVLAIVKARCRKIKARFFTFYKSYFKTLFLNAIWAQIKNENKNLSVPSSRQRVWLMYDVRNCRKCSKIKIKFI